MPLAAGKELEREMPTKFLLVQLERKNEVWQMRKIRQQLRLERENWLPNPVHCEGDDGPYVAEHTGLIFFEVPQRIIQRFD